MYWAEYVASLSSNTNTGTVWTAVKKMTGTYRQSFQPLKKNQVYFFSKEDKAQIHTKNFQKQMYSTKKKQYDKNILSTIQKAKQKGNQKIDQRFTIHEFHNSIDNLKQKKAYGSDEICNEFIKNLPTTKKQELLGIYNRSWQTGKLPAEWKLGLIIPILKPGKCPLTPESYRPITLLQCLGKLMENMVSERLKFFSESNKIIPDTQHGFRYRRSTLDPLLGIEKEIRTALVKRQLTVLVFFNLKAIQCG